MKANAVVTAAAAAALALSAVDQASAQRDDTRRAAPAPVRVELSSGGLVLNFSDIDRNKDGTISVEEWNAFIATLPSRAARSDSGGNAAGGASAAEKPLQPKR
jgi:EF hand